MKKQPKRKQKPKNRPKRRQAAQNRRPDRASRHAMSPSDRFARDVAAADRRRDVGDLVGWFDGLLEALANSTDPSVRASATYRNTEYLAAGAASGLRHVIIPCGLLPRIEDRITRFTRPFGLHLYLVTLEASFAGNGAETLMNRAEWLTSGILELEHVDGYEDGAPSSSLHNLVAARLFDLGHFAEAEQRWEAVRENLVRTGRLDTGADRLLASNAAIARWRAGDESGAIAALERSLRSRPLTESDNAMSLYPLVGYVELLRSSGRATEAATALERLSRTLIRHTPLAAVDLTEERQRDIEHLTSIIGEMDDFAAIQRTYFPHRSEQQQPGYIAYYGSAPGVLILEWCTPEELLALHGPDDPLLVASVRVLSMMATGPLSYLPAIRLLARVRVQLEAQAPQSPLIAELKRVQAAAFDDGVMLS